MCVTHKPLRLATHIILAATALFVGYVEGFINPFAAWNIFPIAVVWTVFRYADMTVDSNLPKQLKIYGLVFFTAGAVVVAHLAWLLDWGETATGSSTSGLMFATLPFLTLLAGCIGWLTGWCIALILKYYPK